MLGLAPVKKEQPDLECFFGRSRSVYLTTRCLAANLGPVGVAPVFLTPRCRAANIEPVGAHAHREAAMAVFQTGRHRCLAVLVRSTGPVFGLKQRRAHHFGQ